MKTYFFILFVALLGTRTIKAFPKSSKNVPDCSQFEDGEKLPDINSCSQYYLCVGGKSLPQRCARGLYYDAMSGLCNRAFLVDCSINRLGQRVHDIVNSIPNVNFDKEMDSKNDERPIPHAAVPTSTPPCNKDITYTTTPCTTTTTTCKPTTKSTETTTCTTTTPCTNTKPTTKTCTTTKCTTTTCSTTKRPTTTCSTTKSTTTTCSTTKSTTTTCSTTKCTTTPCSTTKCTTTPCSTTKCTTTPCSTTTCTTPKSTKAPCSSITTTCTTTKPPCSSTTTVCVTTAAAQKQSLNEKLSYLSSHRDCRSLPEGTILLDYNHCRRFHVCTNQRPIRYTCRTGYWFDQDDRTCRPRNLVTNCAGRR